MKKMSQQIPPAEVIIDILYRLPFKSVGRFRCVSKGWLSLLTDPQFIKTHEENTLKQHHLIFESKIQSELGYNHARSFFLYSHPFSEIVVTTPAKFSLELKGVQEIEFSSSCNGLVLVRGYDNDWSSMLFLVNPTTREILALPDDYYDEFDVEMIDVEDLRCDILYGFGYDSMTDDYKVVALIKFDGYEGDDDDADEVNGVYVYVYSLKSKTWRRVIHTDSPYNYSESSDGVFVNGFIHWIVSTYDNLLVISVFSLADESFIEVPIPNFCNLTDILGSKLVVLGRKLAIFLQDKGEIWLMNEFGVTESWTKISLHGINKIPIFEPEVSYRKPKPVVIDDDAKILVANNDRMMVYDVEKGTFDETVCVWNSKNLSVLGSYVESLVSLKHNVTKQKSTNSNKGICIEA